MSIGSILVVLLSFFGALAFVCIVTYFVIHGKKTDTKDGFFLGGRSLTGVFIAGSLILTNISAVSFIGMSAQSYTGNMSVMGWEVTSGIALVIVALFLVPRYLKQGITTIPDFLENRYDQRIKTLVTALFLFEYIVNLLPVTLYTGALMINGVFDIHGVFGITKFTSIAIICVIVGILGFFYAIYGGLRAIVVSDTINGFGLLIGGCLIPILGLIFLGHVYAKAHGLDHGGLFLGWHVITTIHPQKMLSIGGHNSELPFSSFFTGLLLVNLYYWGTDQAITQRLLGAKNLKEGQKGAIYAGAIKTITPFMLILPGIIAFHLFNPHNLPVTPQAADGVYVHLVNTVLPKPLIGLFVAAMFGAMMSVFNGILNASATLFTLNIYQPLTKRQLTDRQSVTIGRWFSVVVAIVAVVIAPFVMFAPQGIFNYLQQLYGLASVPIFAILVVGYLTKRTPTIAAVIGLIFFVLTYAVLQFTPHQFAAYFGPFEWLYNTFFLNQLGFLFAVTVILMLIIGKIAPRKEPYILPTSHAVDMKPWEFRFEASAIVLYAVLGAYLSLSKIGFVDTNKTFMVAYVVVGSIMLAGFAVSVSRKLRAHKNDGDSTSETNEA